MKVLIIGSKGFIGSNLAKYFSDILKHEVYECDVVVDYQKNNYILIDASNSDFHSLFLNQHFDVCINCSGAASVPDSLVHPLRDYVLNTHNVFKMLDAIRLYQPQCKFINLSSAAVYGNPQSLPVEENFATAPISPYGLHKAQAEQICREFYDYYGVRTCSLRIFSAYGNGLRKQLLWDMQSKFTATNIVELFGTGDETRDFIHIRDLVNSIECCVNGATFQGECINIGNGIEISIRQVADIVRKYYPASKTITFNGKTKPGDPLYWRADISKLKTLGYISRVSIEEGIGEYIKWSKNI